MRRALASGLVVGLAVVCLWLLVSPPVFLLDPGPYDRTNISLTSADGEQRVTLSVRIADTRAKRRVGLSRTDSLENDSGMLFVHPRAGRHTYVMRNMSFSLDILFIAPNGTVTSIHHAPADGGSYRGRGRYVLEVPRGWSNKTGITTGARLTRLPGTETSRVESSLEMASRVSN